MPYTAAKPSRAESSDELRARIPGWGAGRIRRHAYDAYSEARAAHWLLLLAADRVDAWEHHLRSFATLRPDNPITQTGILSERRRHGISSRLGTGRADVVHQTLDPVIVAGPWVAVGAAAFVGVRTVARAARRARGSSMPVRVVAGRRVPRAAGPASFHQLW